MSTKKTRFTLCQDWEKSSIRGKSANCNLAFTIEFLATIQKRMWWSRQQQQEEDRIQDEQTHKRKVQWNDKENIALLHQRRNN